jgi:hypothetical protein
MRRSKPRCPVGCARVLTDEMAGAVLKIDP